MKITINVDIEPYSQPEITPWAVADAIERALPWFFSPGQKMALQYQAWKTDGSDVEYDGQQIGNMEVTA